MEISWVLPMANMNGGFSIEFWVEYKHFTFKRFLLKKDNRFILFCVRASSLSRILISYFKSVYLGYHLSDLNLSNTASSRLWPRLNRISTFY